MLPRLMPAPAEVSNRDHPHLPAGRQPGGQSRRRGVGAATARTVMPIVAGGCALALYVPVVVAAIIALLAALDGGSTVVWIVAAWLLLVAVAAPVGGWYAYRRRRPGGPPPGLSLSLLEQESPRGGIVGARLQADDPERAGDGIEVGLICMCWYDHEVTRNTDGVRRKRRMTASEREYESWVPAQPLRDQVIDLPVPPDAPFSYEGEAMTYAWRVSLVDKRRPMSSQPIELPVWVTP